MTELEEVTKIVAQKRNITNPKKPIYILRFDEKEDPKLPIIYNNDYIGFARAIVENIVLVYEIKLDRDIGCFSYTYQDHIGFTLPADRVYHMPHNRENTLCRRIYKNIITNSAYRDDEDIISNKIASIDSNRYDEKECLIIPYRKIEASCYRL